MDVLIAEERIQSRVADLARQIAADYQGKPLTIVAILTGSLVLLADLIREMNIPLRVAVMQASSYRGSRTVAGSLHIHPDLMPDLRDRDVLLLDDILDTGQTLVALVDQARALGPRSVRTAVLLRKVGRQTVNFEPDYCGFEIPDAFVVGYGLDYDDDYRYLRFIGVLPEQEGEQSHRGLTGEGDADFGRIG